jgi:1,4-alpha-glucan branching enzyme
VLFAPFKNYVYAIGDFNDWIPDNSYLMNKDGDRYWITLTGLTPGKEYIFQYLIDGNLRIADPYTEKTSDPNDKYISSTIYPDLIAYPDSKTSEVASVFQTAQTSHGWQVTDFTPPAKERLVIYELHIRDFTANRDIKTVTDTLSYLKRLGINAIELMPISEFEGNDSWGYNPSFYFAPDKAYGTRDDYKKFIDACHKNGIAVIQDMVLNHSYNQSPLVRMYFDGTNPTSQNLWYNQTSPNTTYSWGNDFNHESPYTKKLVDSITSFWMSEYKMDGFRFDFTKGFTNTPGDGWAYDASRIVILKRMASEIWKRKPNAYVIFEHLTANSEETELANAGIMLWGNMTSAYSEATMGFNDSGKSDFSWISYKDRGWNNPNVVGYMESHDEERLMYKNLTFGNYSIVYNIKDLATALNRMKMAASFFYTIPGPKMLWQFGELGYDISIDQGGRLGQKPIHWDYYSNTNRRSLYEVSKALIQLKKDEPVFSANTFTLELANPVKHIELLDASANVELVGNFDVISKDYTLNFPSSGKWYDYFKGDSIALTGTSYPMTLKPGEYHLFSSKRFTNSGKILTSVSNKTEYEGVSVYPNPFSTEIVLEGLEKVKTLDLYNLQGEKILSKNSPLTNTIDTSNLPAGMYFLSITLTNGKKTIVKTTKI